MRSPRKGDSGRGKGLVIFRFQNRFVVTDRPEEQALIEGHEYFGKHIWPLALEV